MLHLQHILANFFGLDGQLLFENLKDFATEEANELKTEDVIPKSKENYVSVKNYFQIS